MIYFNRELQAHVYNLLHESLVMFGVIGLGAKETMKFSPHEHAYEDIESTARLYRRIG
jgi:chemotaxis protein methyltransferase CheR